MSPRVGNAAEPPATLAAILAALATVACWGSAFPFIRLALVELQPIPLAAARFGVAAIPFAFWLVWKRPPFPTPQHILRFGLCSLLGIALYNVLLNGGQVTVPAGAASFLLGTVPALTALLAAIFLSESLSKIGMMGTALSLFGIAGLSQEQPGGLDVGAGASLILCAAFCQAGYFVVLKPLVAHYGATACAAYTLIGGFILLSPWLPSAATELSRASMATQLAVLFLGLVPAAIGYSTWSYASGKLGATRASNFLFLVPPVATFLGYFLNREIPTIMTFLAGFLVLVGVAIVNVAVSRDRRSRAISREQDAGEA